MSSRTYLSIGDVLALLRQEFPDVTISKIRFLESQGLVNPERTPSGYRKFYEHDVERLRWVLRQQREHFLPLKVIKGRLEQEVAGDGEDNGRDVAGAGAFPIASSPCSWGGRAAPATPGPQDASCRDSSPRPLRPPGEGSTRDAVARPGPAPAPTWPGAGPCPRLRPRRRPRHRWEPPPR